MSIVVERITESQADRIASTEEGQFSDVKAIEIAPGKLTKTISAFANSDGGDLFVGVDEIGTSKERRWRGFDNQEAANGHLQAFEPLFPLGTDFHLQFLRCEFRPGLVLHIQISRTQDIKRSSNDMPYIRRGAQSIPVDKPEMLKRLEYTKGLISFETLPVSVGRETVTDSEVITKFIAEVVPNTLPEAWLRKQNMLRDDLPTVAAVLLFSDEPQAAIPKRCGIKIYRYKTNENDGFRDALAFTPKTVEGSLYNQIKDAVAETTTVTESIPKMGRGSLEKFTYPSETLHEIITNAALHRDYSIADDVHIRIFDNRIEVLSPGRLPAHITVKNILTERFARNGTIVRILNKFPDPPNKDIGEGLNTAFAAMHKLGLKQPVITELENAVLVTIKHESLASPEEAIMDYLSTNATINNKKAREITHVSVDHQIRRKFKRMIIKGLIEHVEGTVRGQTQYRRKNTMVPLEIPKLDEAKKVESHQNENFGNENTTPLPPNGQMTLFN